MKNSLMSMSLLLPLVANAHVGDDSASHHALATVLAVGVATLVVAALLHPTSRETLRRWLGR